MSAITDRVHSARIVILIFSDLSLCVAPRARRPYTIQTQKGEIARLPTPYPHASAIYSRTASDYVLDALLHLPCKLYQTLGTSTSCACACARTRVSHTSHTLRHTQ